MTRTEIIQELYTGKDFNDAINKMEPDHLRQDLKQEIAIMMCELPDDRVVELHQRGEFRFYVVRCIINLAGNKGKHFHKLFRSLITEPLETEEFGECKIERHVFKTYVNETRRDREVKEAIQDIALSEIDNLYWYDAELLRMYMRVGTFRGIEDETGIPFESCYKNIKKSLALLKKRAFEIGEQRAVFSKEELSFIQNSKI